ncbi:MAG: hypothetical protein NW201_04905 [Gemmatimonadales bacterium]|nr:hypothetical protein [Gemmatimonadales bacterium]
MVQTIRLDAVLGAASTRHLVTRATGRAVRSQVQSALGDEAAVTCLDFSCVGLVDFSGADEVVAQLLLATGTRPLVLRVAVHHLDAIEPVLQHHRLACVCIVEERPSLVGSADGDERAAWAAVVEAGPLTADALAAHLGWGVPRAAAVLDGLARRGVLRRLADGAAAALPVA